MTTNETPAAPRNTEEQLVGLLGDVLNNAQIIRIIQMLSRIAKRHKKKADAAWQHLNAAHKAAMELLQPEQGNIKITMRCRTVTPNKPKARASRKTAPHGSDWFRCSRCGVSGPWSDWISASDPDVHRCDICHNEGRDHELLSMQNNAVRGAAEPRTLDGLVGRSDTEGK